MPIKFEYKKHKPFTEGGEGLLFNYQNNILKIYKNTVNINSKKHKVKSLMKADLPSCVIKPIDIVTDKSDNFIGFEMENVNGEELKRLSNKKFILSNNITTKDVLDILIKIKDTVDILHKQNIYIGDFNDQNILFDNKNNIYFIDCDSWVIDNETCEVAMPQFLDPKIDKNIFNNDTDNYAFAIIAWKTLTLLHPFGGTYKPDDNMSIENRMKKGISVIDNNDIIIPRAAKNWNNLSPSFISNMKNIFENKTRVLSNDLYDMYNNLAYCNTDKEYYYSKYNECPLCHNTAKIISKPNYLGEVNGFNIYAMLNTNDIKTIININTYIDNNDNVINIKDKRSIKYEFGYKYYFVDSSIIETDKNNIYLNVDNKNCVLTKKYNSDIIVEDNIIYYISSNDELVKSEITKYGLSCEPISKCSNWTFFNIENKKFCLVNCYSNKILININNYTTVIDDINDVNITNYGIHYDEISDSWLIILENNNKQIYTKIIKDNRILYTSKEIKYKCNLDNICFNNNTIFIPINAKIRGYSYSKEVFKDFECKVVDEDSKLLRKNKKFIIINTDNVYNFG